MKYGFVSLKTPRALSLWVGSVWLLLGGMALSAEFISVGPAYQEFSVTLAPTRTRTEIAGPFFYRECGGEFSQTAFPPFFSRTDDTGVDMTELDVLYPLLTYDRFGAEYRFQILQLFSFAGGQSQSGNGTDRFTLFPFYFQQRSPDTNQNYTALLPFYGQLKGRLMRDEINFVMLPLYLQSRKKDVVTDNYLLPFFHVRQGEQLKGWQFWPFIGHEHKGITTRTNVADEVEMVGGHDKFFAPWPFYMNSRLGIGTTNEQMIRLRLPFYTDLRSPLRDSTTYLWPFFTVTEDREKNFREWDVPYPLLVFARGEGKYTTRIWPFYSHATNAVLTSDFIMWPLYKYNRAQAAPLDRERTRVLWFFYSDVVEKNTETGAYSRRHDLWPLLTYHHSLDGSERLQIGAFIETFLPNNKSVERNWSPLWSVWRAERNGKTGALSQSFLWNLYRHEEAAGVKKDLLLFGLIQYESDRAGAHWRWFHFPKKQTEETVVPLLPPPTKQP